MGIALAAVAYAVGFLVANWSSRSARGMVQTSEHNGQQATVQSDSPDLQLDDINLGIVQRGGKRAVVTWLRNAGDHPVVLGKLKPSCGCVSVKILDSEIRPRNKIPALIVFDASQEPDFTGSLAVLVSIVDDAGRETVAGKVSVEVSADATLCLLTSES